LNGLSFVIGFKEGKVESLKCFDVSAWRKYDRPEMIAYLKRLGAISRKEGISSIVKSLLIFRRHLCPVDIYCYLRARFGEPNGLQTQLARKDTSDNLFLWDFNLKAEDEDVYICGTYREVHFMVSEALSDADWPKLIARIKKDYRRVSKEKSQVFKSLERWVIFPNRYMQIAKLCADLHKELSSILANNSISSMQSMSASKFQNAIINEPKTRRAMVRRATKLFQGCLELSLLTPVFAEAFINMSILILCKKEIKDNRRQFDAFIRSQIDVKIFDLPYKCNSFVKAIDHESPEFKTFKSIMDNRNNTIHGNVDPERERLETLYFEGKRPLFEEPGDHLLKYFQALEQQLDAKTVIKNYENTHAFLLSIGECLDPAIRNGFWQVMETTYPGYELDRKILGVLLPDRVVSSYPAGARYDDELSVDWSMNT
jgi:hypothetical protein